MSKRRYIGNRADQMNARLGRLLREIGVDTCAEPYASVLGGHKHPSTAHQDRQVQRIGNLHGTLDRQAMMYQRQKRMADAYVKAWHAKHVEGRA